MARRVSVFRSSLGGVDAPNVAHLVTNRSKDVYVSECGIVFASRNNRRKTDYQTIVCPACIEAKDARDIKGE